MARITRCSTCSAHVHADSTACHTCGDPLEGRRRLLGRGAWTFIILAVGVFAVCDSVHLLNRERNRQYRDTLGMKTADAFLKAYLRDDSREMKRFRHRGSELQRKIAKSLSRNCEVFPIDGMEYIHLQPNGIVRHYPDPRRRNRTRQDYARRYQFRAHVKRDDHRYLLHGRIVVDGRTGRGQVVAFELDGIDRTRNSKSAFFPNKFRTFNLTPRSAVPAVSPKLACPSPPSCSTSSSCDDDR